MLTLAFVLHNHQPVGNLDMVLDEAYATAYLPMLELLERHPHMRFVTHYTGPLLDWLEGRHPDFLGRLRSLLADRGAEVLGGGLYEPVLAAIPDADKAGQLGAMSDRLAALLGARPSGVWLAERVWEPHLPAHLARAGVAYTILDEEHFAKAGVDPGAARGPWTTEDGGHVLRLVPASTDLRYLIPWRDVDEVMGWLYRQYEAGRDLVVFADDGEKLGGWPGTYRHCYENGWLERFFGAIAAGASWLRTGTLEEYVRERPPAGRVYIPSASYHELEEWSLPAATQRALAAARAHAEAAGVPEVLPFTRVGHWRNFLAKYEEANVMHQRGAGLSARVHAMPPGEEAERARRHLWQAQCNCPYWHGVFGGVYLYHIRHAAFAQLIAAEALAEALPSGAAVADEADYDADGAPEARLATPEQALFVHGRGGHLYEWDLRRLRLNLLNTLAPYREAYATPEPSEAPEAFAPPPPRRAFMEYLLDGMPQSAEEVGEALPDRAGLLLGRCHVSARREGGRALAVAEQAAAFAWGEGRAGLRLRKTFAVDAGEPGLTVTYEVEPEGLAHAGRPVLAVELNFAPPPGCHLTGALSCADRDRGLMEEWAEPGQRRCRLRCDAEPPLALAIEWDDEATLLSQPLLSRGRGEHGAERVYQGTRLVLAWTLPPDGGPWKQRLRLRVGAAGVD